MTSKYKMGGEVGMWTFSSNSFWSEAAAHSGQPGADLTQDIFQQNGPF